MTDNMLTISETATRIIASDVRAFKADKTRYSSYVAECEITSREEVAAHVALFRDAYRTAYPKADGDEVKAYATKVRNGLNYWVGKGAAETKPSVLRATLSGEGGGTVVIDRDTDPDLYDRLVTLITGVTLTVVEDAA